MTIFLSICCNFIYLLYLFVFGLTTPDPQSILRRLGTIPAYIYKHKLISTSCLNNVVIQAQYTFLSCITGQHSCVYFHLY